VEKLLFSMQYYATMKWLAINCTQSRQFIVSYHNAKKIYNNIERGFYDNYKKGTINQKEENKNTA
jgi:hypothetical protein